MEENLVNCSCVELEIVFWDSSCVLQVMFVIQLCSFDDYFQYLLNDLEWILQGIFLGVFGELYMQNIKVFWDLYVELCLYYCGVNLYLEEMLVEFWVCLFECFFKQLYFQLLLFDDYLDCLGKQVEVLWFFGEVLRELCLWVICVFVVVCFFV